MDSAAAALSAVGLFDEGGVAFVLLGDFGFELLGFGVGGGLGGLEVGRFGLGGAELEHGGLELLAEFEGGVRALGGGEGQAGREERERE